MVGASEAIRELGIPRTSFYRLIKDGVIVPVQEDRKPWQRRTVKRFRVSEIRKALDKLGSDHD